MNDSIKIIYFLKSKGCYLEELSVYYNDSSKTFIYRFSCQNGMLSVSCLQVKVKTFCFYILPRYLFTLLNNKWTKE